MKKQELKINCVICGDLITETTNIHSSISQLAKENKVSIMLITDKHKEAGGYLCQDCNKVFSSQNPKLKVVKTTLKTGNSSGICLPVKWLRKKVLVYLLE